MFIAHRYVPYAAARYAYRVRTVHLPRRVPGSIGCVSAAVVGSSRRARNDMVNLLATPKSDNPWLKRYSYWLKFEGNLFMGIFFVGYLMTIDAP